MKFFPTIKICLLSLALAPPFATYVSAFAQVTATVATGQDRCPLTIFIDARGRLYDSRFSGRYRVSEATLRSDLAGGCKEDGPTSSVHIHASAQARYARVQAILGLIRSVNPSLAVVLDDAAQAQPSH